MSRAAAADGDGAHGTPSTRDRLLGAAVRLFAEQGFDATSVRQACDAAGANVAAVSYHFGSKSALYDAAIDFARAESNERNPWVELDAARDFWAGAPPETRLRNFVAMMLDHALAGEGRASDLSRIMMHEMLDPTPAFERQVEVSIARVFAALRGICRELWLDAGGAAPDEPTLTRLALLVSGQCLYPALAADCLASLHPETSLDRDGRAALAELVADGVLGLIRGRAERT